MPYYRRTGEVPPKRHTQFRRPDGGLHTEELMGVEGFSSASALLYHRRLPTAIVDAQVVEREPEPLVDNHPLAPRHLRTHDLKAGGDVVTGRQLLLGNADCRIGYVVADQASPLYRNAIGDEVVYVESGALTLHSVYGTIEATTGDYVVVPTSTTHRWIPREPTRALVVEAAGHVGPPKRYLSAHGQYLEHSPYCERDLRGPDDPLLAEAVGEDPDAATEVLVRHRGQAGPVWTRYTYEHHPFDVVGWDGCLYPHAFSIRDFEPITGRVHQPPPVHQTFEGPNFVICSFVPRKFDYHPESIPAPYNHANVDSDEVLFYAEGEFAARKGSAIATGSISLHPSGFTHGPQPGAAEASIGADATDETAVMVDTFRPLLLGPAALGCEDAQYPWSWSGRAGGGDGAP